MSNNTGLHDSLTTCVCVITGFFIDADLSRNIIIITDNQGLLLRGGKRI